VSRAKVGNLIRIFTHGVGSQSLTILRRRCQEALVSPSDDTRHQPDGSNVGTSVSGRHSTTADVGSSAFVGQRGTDPYFT